MDLRMLFAAIVFLVLMAPVVLIIGVAIYFFISIFLPA